MNDDSDARKRVVETVRSALIGEDDVRLALVFGSAAMGPFLKTSDVDVAVSGKRPLTAERLAELASTLSAALSRDVDMVDLKAIDGLVFNRAITRSVVLKDSQSEYPYLLARALFWKADFEPILRRMRAVKLERFVHDGY